MEQGERTISVEEAQALAQALGVSLMQLPGESQPETEQEEGIELRFEVTVKLLPSREEKSQPTTEEIRQMIENPPPGEPYAEKVERVFGRAPGTTKQRTVAERSSKAELKSTSKRRTKQ
jgi:hypothetical protein